MVLDASVMIAHLDRDDVHHAAATDLLLHASPGSMVVHSLTLAEVLVAGARHGRAAAMRRDLLAAGLRVADRDDDEPLRLAELRAGTSLKLPDCCVLDLALHRPASLATFDAGLAREAERRGVVVLTGR